jgi:paraquat-inducible protein B
MSKKANPTQIGLFIVSGLGLALAGLILFSSMRWFSGTHEFILYFNNSLNGLNEGAPVKYRGVIIGSVKRVMIYFNQATNDYAMPVLIEVRDDLVQKKMNEKSDPFDENSFNEHVRQGMRASLQAESLVTGVLYVEIRPDGKGAEPAFHQLNPIYAELPTEPTDVQQLMNNLAGLDLKGTVAKVDQLIARLDLTVSNLNLFEIGRDLTNTLVSINAVVRSPQVTNSLSELAGTLRQYRLLAEKVGQQVDPVAGNITNTLAETTRTLAQLRGCAEGLRTLLIPDSPLRNDLDETLQQLSGAAESIASLAEFLRQHPNAVITGRKTSENP